MNGLTLVHLGCGPCVTPSHWIDFDGSWNARVNRLPGFAARAVRAVHAGLVKKPYVYPKHVRYMNVARPLTLPGDYADAIFASHLWEHLYYEEAVRLSAECFRVMKAGGRLRVVVPPLHDYCREYADAPPSRARAIELNRKLLFRAFEPQKGLATRLFGALADLHSHKFMYDPECLAGMLQDAGFEDVGERRFLESEIPFLQEVENPGRLGPGIGFAVEGCKPGGRRTAP